YQLSSQFAGRGMGLIIGNLLNREFPQVYVANDETANFLLEYDPQSETLEDRSLICGGAADRFGATLGSMGIAAGDADRNGLPDLFVTNYYSQANTLYVQAAGGQFADRTSEFRLLIPGYAMLGFGCQFADFDADGDDDLFVANGHLDDFRFRGHPWKMRPQLFCNNGRGAFSEVAFGAVAANGSEGLRVSDRKSSADYFQQEVLGRAVALLDWNQDGATDIVVTHLDRPAALLSNHSVSPNSADTVTFRLSGTHSPRRPIGAVVRRTDNPADAAWLWSGNGYECSSEPTLRLCVPHPDSSGASSGQSHSESSGRGTAWTITWPSATSAGSEEVRTQHVTVSAISETEEHSAGLVVIEGRNRVYRIPR
ncbi:MAG: VCBS repeat-containing protein, partial [Planctomycetaceae bacterium]|nr:VCBS repeat-containing protein [Planctomycetaceae bacterium]